MLDADVREAAEAGVDAVDDGVAGQELVDGRAGGFHAAAGAGGEGDGLGVHSDGTDRLEGQGRAVEQEHTTIFPPPR